jgi:hypothetical protein
VNDDTLLCTSVGVEGVCLIIWSRSSLYFVLCGCGSLSFTFRGHVGRGCFENSLLRKVFGPKVKE